MPVLVDKTKCTGCGKCVDACYRLVYALETEGGKKIAVPNREEWCLRCFICVDHCPTGAIEVNFKKRRSINFLEGS